MLLLVLLLASAVTSHATTSKIPVVWKRVRAKSPSRLRPPPSPPGILEQRITHSGHAWAFDWSARGRGLVPDDCPGWIKEYLAFHKQQRGQPGAKYLINACLSATECKQGIGDRLRGLLPSVQLAKAHNRVLLIAWTVPHPLETFLGPALVNWTLTPDLNIDPHQALQLDAKRAELTDAMAGPGADDARVWILKDYNNMVYQKYPMPAGISGFRQVSWQAHCIYRALLQPTPTLNQAMDAVQRQLIGSTDEPFVAMHLRLGHLKGEDVRIHRGWDAFEGIMASYRCAVERDALIHGDAGFVDEHLTTFNTAPTAQPGRKSRTLDVKPAASPRHSLVAAQQGKLPHQLAASQLRPTHNRIILLTDHEELRHMVAQGMLRGVAGPSYAAHHFGLSPELMASNTSNLDVTMSVFVDLMLLARANCVVWSKSGFNKFPMAWAWTPCTVQLESCLEHPPNATSITTVPVATNVAAPVGWLPTGLHGWVTWLGKRDAKSQPPVPGKT